MEENDLVKQISALVDDRQPFEAIDLMCEQATARQNIWWGCSCAWSLWRPQPPLAEDPLLGLVSSWIMSGDDGLRVQATQQLPEWKDAVCKWLVQAMINSGGSLKIEDATTEQLTPDVSGPFVKAFIHQLLAANAPVEKLAEAQKYCGLAVQVLSEPLPSLAPAA